MDDDDERLAELVGSFAQSGHHRGRVAHVEVVERSSSSTYSVSWASTMATAAAAIDPARMADGEAHHRVEEITVSGWVLYDEFHLRGSPRQPLRRSVPPRAVPVGCPDAEPAEVIMDSAVAW